MKRIIIINLVLSFGLAYTISIFTCIKLCPQQNVIQILDNNKSLVFIRDKHKDTLLHYAVRYRKYRLIRYLVHNKADVGAIGSRGKTAADIAAENKDVTAMRYLMLSPTFAKVKDKKPVRTFIASNKTLNELLRENFREEEEDENAFIEKGNFLEESKRFYEKVKERSRTLRKYKKRNIIKSRSSIDKKSHNSGNIQVMIK